MVTWCERYCGICGETTPHEDNRCVECARRPHSELLASALPRHPQPGYFPQATQPLQKMQQFQPNVSKWVRGIPQPRPKRVTMTMVIVLGNEELAFDHLQKKFRAAAGADDEEE